MIYYFSGTGNSEWVAKELAEKLGDQAVSMVEVMDQISEIDHGHDACIGLVFPVYAWAPPEIVLTFAKKLQSKGNYMYGVCTYGGEPGHAMKILGKILPINGQFGVLMPSNYVIGMSVDAEELAKKKVTDARGKLVTIAEKIRNRLKVDDVVPGAMAGLKSTLAAAAFNRFGRRTGPFHVEAGCNGCGLCVQVCPAKTINLKEGVPVWKSTCYQCLACINRCPQQAIEYGKASQGKGRYYFNENISER